MAIGAADSLLGTDELRGNTDPFARRATVLLVGGLVLTAVAGLLSDGVYHEDDLQHFLFARWVGHDPCYLINEWGRPGFTVPYALPAMMGSTAVGWHACRLLSAVFAAATAWLCYRIARHYHLRDAWTAIPLLYLQPLFTRLSLTTLTETPLTFYFALGTWLLLRRQPIASAVVIALGPVTRHEAMMILPIWAVALWQSRSHWLAYPLLLWAVVLHNLLAARWLGSPPIEMFLAPAGATGYGQGTPLSFVPRLLFAAGPVVVALAVMGTIRLANARLGWLPTAGCALYFVVETVIYMRGAYSSGGYARFLVPMAPWLAVLATAGLQTFFGDRRRTFSARPVRGVYWILLVLWIVCEIEWYFRPADIPVSWQAAFVYARIILVAGLFNALAMLAYEALIRGWTPREGVPRRWVTILAAVLALAPLVWAVRPLRLLNQHRITREAAGVLTQRGWDRRPLMSVSYWPYYWADRWIPNHPRTWRRETLAKAEPGTIFVWDARRCPHPDCSLPLADLADDPAWRLLWASRPDDDASTSFVALFERQ